MIAVGISPGSPGACAFGTRGAVNVLCFWGGFCPRVVSVASGGISLQ